MRMRNKKWADDELSRSPIFLGDYKDMDFKSINLNELFLKPSEIHLEIGIGKGKFLADIAYNNPNINYIGVDIAEQMLAITKRTLENTYLNVTKEKREYLEDSINSMSQEYFKAKGINRPKNITINKVLNSEITDEEISGIPGFDRNNFDEYIFGIEKIMKKRDLEVSSSKDVKLLDIYNKLKYEAYNKSTYPNVIFFKLDAKDISEIFKSTDGIERIYLNFSNPWYKDRHKKRRLTHTNKLKQYSEFLVGKKEIYFKTDDLEFFNESKEYFKEANFDEVVTTNDLKNNDIFNGNVVTEHEEMFSKEGIKINAGIYKYLG